MKTLHRIPILFALVLVTLSGCEIDLETSIIVDERNKYIGRYEVEEYSEGAAATFVYDIWIRKSRYPDGIIWIDNIYDTSIKVFAEVHGHSFFIPFQRIGNLEIEGRGNWFPGDELSISYSVREIVTGPDYVDYLSCTAWKY